MEQTVKNYSKRNAILECLQSTKEHPSAETVHRMLLTQRSDISLATVYRNLALFKQQGIIQSVATVGGVERFDYNTAPHVHFVCRRCQAVIDLPDIAVPEQMRSAVTASIGAQVERCQLQFYGVCRFCCRDCGTQDE